jgi:hypothetical protein
MGMAAALSVIVWRLLRDERQRSEARVEALRSAAGSLGGGAHAAPADGATYRSARPAGVRSGAGGAASDGASHTGAAASRIKQRGDDLPLHASTPVAAPVMTSHLFDEPEHSSPWGNRFAVMAGLALVGAAIVLVGLTATRTRGVAPAHPAVAAPAAAEPAAAGLELLSLRDSRQGGTLTITGLVQNPRAGALLSRVTVTAFAFDDKGSFLASGRALLDVTSLAAGDESPFVVAVPVTEAVARYRIGFRGEDGRVIAHVDKRQHSPLASLQTAAGRPNW